MTVQLQATDGVVPSTGEHRRISLRSILRAPFTAATWKATAYALIALPLAVVGVVLAAAGRHDTARALQARACRALLDVDLGQPGAVTGRGAVLGHALLSVPVNAAVLILTIYFWTVVLVNVACPWRPDTDDLSNAWGGPTLAGAWAVHAAGGLVFLFVAPWIVRGLAQLQAALSRRMLEA